VQNSTAVFQLKISNKTSFCASISRPTRSPKPLRASLKKTKTMFNLFKKTEKQIIGKDIFLIFTISDYEFETKDLKKIIERLNENEYKTEYLNWMKTWGQ
jgi:sugar diacid utilization regulator